jgi:hypothetical protein
MSARLLLAAAVLVASPNTTLFSMTACSDSTLPADARRPLLQYATAYTA